MAYQTGDTIAAADLNSFLSTVNNVFAVGSGNAGYGQTSLQAAVAAGATVASSHWTNLRSMIVTSANHQGTSQTTLVGAAALAAGATIAAENTAAPSNASVDIPNTVAAINTNRLVAAAGSMTLSTTFSTGGPSVTRGTAWSTTITCTVDIAFGSENATRYFFNSGGQLRLSFTQPTGSGTSQDTDWSSTFTNKVGTIALGANGTTNTGTSQLSAAAVGFYQLTATPATVYNGTNIGGGAYAANDVLVTAAVRNVVGLNGGNGDTVRFVITLNDDHTGSTDSVSLGTAANFAHYRATTYLSGIGAPSFTQVVGF